MKIGEIILILLVLSGGFEAIQSKDCKYGTVYNDDVCEDCGGTNFKPNTISRIVNGLPAIPHSWPSQAQIVQSYTGEYDFRALGGKKENVSIKHSFGGFLLNRYTVLTAAHSIGYEFYQFLPLRNLSLPVVLNDEYPTYEAMFTVYLGAHNISFISNDEPLPITVQKLKVAKIIRYPGYTTKTYQHDIALLILEEPAKINIFTKPVCLPENGSKDFPKLNDDVYASGWGTLYFRGPTPDELQNIRLKVYDTKFCDGVLPAFTKDWNSQLCAGDLAGYKDTCQGDSGGPLYAYDAKIKKYVVVGLTSYGDGCGLPGLPGVYTRISYYLDWIKSNWKTGSNYEKFPLTTTRRYSNWEGFSNANCVKINNFLITIFIFAYYYYAFF